jgi:hypothetical protein
MFLETIKNRAYQTRLRPISKVEIPPPALNTTSLSPPHHKALLPDSAVTLLEQYSFLPTQPKEGGSFF